MNNKLTMALAPMIAFAVLLASCKKDKENITADTAIAGSYRMTALVEVTPDGEEDQFPFLDDCIKDDMLEFKNDNSYVYSDAGNVCDPNGSHAGTWEPKGRNKIAVDGEEVTIVSKTTTQLVMLRMENLDGNTVAYKATYQKL